MNIAIHDLNQPITDLQWSADRTYFITACKDKTSKVSRDTLFPEHAEGPVSNPLFYQLISAKDLEVLKTYPSDTPLNSACMTRKKDFVILGGGQAAMDVTTTAARQGKFEARFYHKIFEDEIGRVRGHFGPLVC
jgi:translation initiation factor 3 subunit I